MKEQDLSRRKVLGFGALALTGLIGRKVTAQACDNQATVQQPEGPFYPVSNVKDKDNDLYYLRGRNRPAKGKEIIVMGRVLDTNCAPVKNSLVEIWQASENGRYNHPADSDENRPIDPNFQYFGLDFSDDIGLFLFRTIIPGDYKADVDWIRPSHIHMRVMKRGFHEIITQMYFEGNRYNATDKILNSLNLDDQKKAISRSTVLSQLSQNLQKEIREEFAHGALSDSLEVYEFNVTLKKV